MFYRTDQPHGLPHNPFAALVVPRPIGWISTLSADGVANLSPYSFFNAIAYEPPQVMFAGSNQHAEGGPKDAVKNIQETGEFVVNLATWDLRHVMSDTSTPAPRDVDEFEAVGIEKAPSELVAPPRVKASPIHLECRLSQIVQLEKSSDDAVNLMVIGVVAGVHISDEVIVDGKVDITKVRPVSRLGYLDYAVVDEVFSIPRPGWPLKAGG